MLFRSGSDLFVNSARSEALSFAMLEALANKLPIVATDVGGNPDICGSDTGCGLLVPYLDTKKMAEALNKIMSDDDLRNKMKENALRTVKTKFDYENMINRTFKTYK